MALGAPDDLTDAVPDGAPYLVSLDAIDIGVSPMAYIHDRVVDRSNATFQVKFEIHRTNIVSGGNDIMFSFNSNGLGAGGT